MGALFSSQCCSKQNIKLELLKDLNKKVTYLHERMIESHHEIKNKLENIIDSKNSDSILKL